MSNMGKRYSKEFKMEAVKLASKLGAVEAAKELGVTAKSLRDWSNGKKLSGSTSSKVKASEAELEKENLYLKKENRNLKLINEVLKKSTAIFSKDHIGDLK